MKDVIIKKYSTENFLEIISNISFDYKYQTIIKGLLQTLNIVAQRDTDILGNFELCFTKKQIFRIVKPAYNLTILLVRPDVERHSLLLPDAVQEGEVLVGQQLLSPGVNILPHRLGIANLVLKRRKLM